MIMVKIVKIRIKILFTISVIIFMFNILIGSLIGGKRSATTLG